VRERLHNIDSKTDQEFITLFYSRSFKRVKRSNDYMHFKLMKSNIDTMGALYRLSKILGCNQKLLSVAGLKDKRGVTTQKVSLYNCQPNIFDKFYKVAFRNRELWVGDVTTGEKDSVALGQLQGNRFSIVIRFVRPKGKVIEQL
jgi:tRNA pseudouridine13 synthase